MQVCRTKAANKDFEDLKVKVSQQQVLVLPNFNKLFIAECDASNVGIGTALSQEGRPVAFFNERLNDAKRKYSSSDLNIYALV